MTQVAARPYDARLAAWLVRPLQTGRVTPNHLTALRLTVGLTGAWLFSTAMHPDLAAALIVVSNFLDHADGELARMSGKSSRFGHVFDLASDAVVTIGMFVGISIGLSSAMGPWALWIGSIAGLAVAGIFHLRNLLETRYGKTATRQPRFAGFEAEDVLYLMPVVTMTDLLAPFLHAAAVGAPLALIAVGVQYALLQRQARTT